MAPPAAAGAAGGAPPPPPPLRRWSLDEFLASAPVPGAAAVRARLDAFVARHARAGRRLALVTSGGTTVPLERAAVRFVDNFSRGARGALSAERLLAAGYAVVFLSREGSAQPYVAELQDSLGGGAGAALLAAVEPAPGGGLRLAPAAAARLEAALRARAEAAAAGTLLVEHFITLFEYMAYLRAAAEALRPAGARALVYAAAAVSDFFLPWAELAEHKIQSGACDDGLRLALPRTPKALGALRASWAPAAFVASFKLETDAALLLPKARAALAAAGVHLVVANELASRKDTVWLVTAAGEQRVDRRPEDGVIEAPLIAAVVAAHAAHIARAAGGAGAAPRPP